MRWQNWIDPVDGYPGLVAFVVGMIYSPLILLFLAFTHSINLDNVAFNMLCLGAGWLTIIGILTIPLWFFIGWATLMVIFGAVLGLVILANLVN